MIEILLGAAAVIVLAWLVDTNERRAVRRIDDSLRKVLGKDEA